MRRFAERLGSNFNDRSFEWALEVHAVNRLFAKEVHFDWVTEVR
jgi:hypothetical protein